MKFVLALILGLSISSHASDIKPTQPKKELSDKQLDVIVGLIDRMCGDTWCEGEYEYSFKAMEKMEDARGYQLIFAMRLYDQKMWSRQTCEFPTRDSFLDYVEPLKSTSGKTKRFVLIDGFVEELNDCIFNIEDDNSAAIPVKKGSVKRIPSKMKREPKKSNLLFY